MKRAWWMAALIALIALIALVAIACTGGSDPFEQVESEQDGGTDANPCQSGQVSCAGACVDIATDERNCGGCGIECESSPDIYCSGGTCRTTSPAGCPPEGKGTCTRCGEGLDCSKSRCSCAPDTSCNADTGKCTCNNQKLCGYSWQCFPPKCGMYPAFGVYEECGPSNCTRVGPGGHCIECPNTCTRLDGNNDHCYACGNKCEAGTHCSDASPNLFPGTHPPDAGGCIPY